MKNQQDKKKSSRKKSVLVAFINATNLNERKYIRSQFRDAAAGLNIFCRVWLLYFRTNDSLYSVGRSFLIDTDVNWICIFFCRFYRLKILSKQRLVQQ